MVVLGETQKYNIAADIEQMGSLAIAEDSAFPNMGQNRLI